MNNNIRKLKNALWIIPKTPTVPIWGFVLLIVKGKRIELRATDIELWYQAEMENIYDRDSLPDGKYLLERVDIKAIIAGASLENVVIDDSVMVEEYPDYPKGVFKSQPVDGDYMGDIMKALKIAGCSSRRSWTSGVFITGDNIVCTDGKRLVVYHNKLKFKGEYIIPGIGIKLINVMKMDVNALGFTKNGMFCFYGDNESISGNLIDAKYPDFKRVIPSDYIHSMEFNESLLYAMKDAYKAYLPYCNDKRSLWDETFCWKLQVSGNFKIGICVAKRSNKTKTVHEGLFNVDNFKPESDYIIGSFNLRFFIDMLEMRDRVGSFKIFYQNPEARGTAEANQEGDGGNKLMLNPLYCVYYDDSGELVYEHIIMAGRVNIEDIEWDEIEKGE